MTSIALQRRRTGWDVATGILLILVSLFILGNTVIATLVSVLTLGWLAVISGIVALVGALFRIGTNSAWFAALSGALLTVLGLMIVRHPGAAAVTLTLMAGTVFLAGGIFRLATAASMVEGRWIAVLSGVASVVLGLIVLLDIVDASVTLLGWLLGLQVLFDGIGLLIIGRIHINVSRSYAPDSAEALAAADSRSGASARGGLG